MSYITLSQQYMRYLLIIYPKQSPQPTFSTFLHQTNRTHELLAWWPVCSDSILENIRHPCKYAITWQTWARIDPMLAASGRFWPRSDRSGCQAYMHKQPVIWTGLLWDCITIHTYMHTMVCIQVVRGSHSICIYFSYLTCYILDCLGEHIIYFWCLSFLNAGKCADGWNPFAWTGTHFTYNIASTQLKTQPKNAMFEIS